ncbi:uncharacterized protein LOC134247254 [Saccostrea cucullata]|uniref:uncharacterized protein LOC134247254 n=1 Tax=Saccostrea cuccullata TaxID=36930 RepID=UPI002ED3164B
MDKIKIRKPNWSEIELEVLIEAYCRNFKVIRGKFSPSITSDTKKRAWEEITERVNAVAVSCNRSLDETKKKIQDSLSSVKKKEAFRKREASKTGGGPCTEIIFKPWEVSLLGTIPTEMIHGLEGAVDTKSDADQGQTKGKLDLNCDLNCPGATGDCSATSNNVSECVVDIHVTSEEPSIPCTALPSQTCKSKKSLEPVGKKRTGGYDNGMKELVELKKRRLDVEERKAQALERIVTILEGWQNLDSGLSVPPVIEF